MNISNSKNATIAQSILLSLTGTRYALRTLECMAKEAGASIEDTRTVVSNMGLITRRRRSDGATLYGIAGRVSGHDVIHTPVAPLSPSAPAPIPVPAPNDMDDTDDTDRLDEAKGRILVALQDPRWRLRTRSALREAGDVNNDELDQILRHLNVRTTSQGYIGLQARR